MRFSSYKKIIYDRVYLYGAGRRLSAGVNVLPLSVDRMVIFRHLSHGLAAAASYRGGGRRRSASDRARSTAELSSVMRRTESR